MKSILYPGLLLALWLGLLCPALAQRTTPGTTAVVPGGTTPVTAEESPYSHVVDSLLAPLNKTAIPTGLLYDRAMPLAQLHCFSEGARLDTSSNAHWRQAQLELFMSAYTRTSFLTPAQVRSTAGHYIRHDSIPLGVLDYQFNYLDSLAAESNLIIEQNGLFYDVAGRPRSPYFTRQLTVAAALVDTISLSSRFYVPSTLLLGNRGRQVSSLWVNFDNQASPQLLLPGQSTLVSYGAGGRKILTITVTFSDGTQAQCRAAVVVKASTVANRTLRLPDVDARIPFRDYITNRGLYGKAEVLFSFQNQQSLAEYNTSTSSARLRRPVLVLDGFDPEDKSQLMGQTREQDESIYDLLVRIDIIPALETLQRDLIIVNFPYSQRQIEGGGTTTEDIDGGADFVERNAMALIEVINQVKGHLADPTEKLTIVGPSMGGLISRYALAYMEKQQQDGTSVPSGAPATYWNHQTASWISYDAPHQGANVPVADQEFLSYYKNATPVAQQNLEAKVNSPAARQMLVHHYSYGSTPNGAAGYHGKFYRALNDNGETGSFGYPVHVRRVALSNGRLDGLRSTDGTVCGYAFQENLVIRYAGLRITKPLFFRRSPFGSLSVADARFTPEANTSCRVFEGQMIFWLTKFRTSLSEPYRQVKGHVRKSVTAGPAGSYDLAPGGTYNAQQQIAEQAETADDKQFYDMYFFNVKPYHSFIPTVSALGYQYRSMANYQGTSSLPNPYENLSDRDLTCTDETPFDAYFGNRSQNTEHIRGLNAPLQQFLLRELSPQTPAPELASNLEEVALCENGYASTVAIRECRLRAGAPTTSYRWVLGGALVRDASLSATGPVQRLSYNASAPNNGDPLYADIYATQEGRLESLPRRIWFYIDAASLTISAQACGWQPGVRMCPGVGMQVAAGFPIGDPASIVWTANGGQVANLAGQTRGYYTLPSGGNQTIVLRATAPDPCNPGATLYSNEIQFLVGSNCTACREANAAPVAPALAVAYPNPADEEVVLTPEGAEEGHPTAAAVSARSAASAAGFQVTVYDWQGRVVTEQTTPQSSLRLVTRAWRSGLYQAVIRHQGRVVRQQLRIQH